MTDRNTMADMDLQNLCFSFGFHEELSSWSFGVSSALESNALTFDSSCIGFSEICLSIENDLPQDSFFCSLKIALEEYYRNFKNFFIESSFVTQIRVLANEVMRLILSFRSAANAFLCKGNVLQANLGIFNL